MSNHVYACSDIHGSLSIWNKIKEILKPNDAMYFLGDACDRGFDGWQIIKEMLDDPRIIYIRGNHEQLLLDAYHASHGLKDLSRIDCPEIDLWMYNGGLNTALAMMEDPEAAIYVNKLECYTHFWASYRFEENDFYLCHAGLSNPIHPKAISTNQVKELLWSRDHFFDDCDHLPDNFTIVHGHTPTDILREDYFDFYQEEGRFIYIAHGDAVEYSEGHKIDIDCGTAYTHRSVLFDLDTKEYIPIQEDGNE